jgi:PAS domain S-box-containing protein
VVVFASISIALAWLSSEQRTVRERIALSLRITDERQLQLQHEVQERRRIEDLLRRQTNALQAHTELMELAHDTIIVRSVDGRITFWNAAAHRMYGWTDDEVQGKNIHELLRSEYGTTLHEINSTLFREGAWEGEITHTRRDGKRVTVVSRWAVQRDEDGKPIAVIEIDRDVTQQRAAEQEIRRLNASLQLRIQELQTLVETIPIGIAVADDPGCNVIRRNRALANMLQAPIESNRDAGYSLHPPFRVFQNGR